MSIKIQEKTNYSFLFSSLGNGAANAAGNSFLADYASIKNGSYGKLMKAYYNETGNDSVNKLVHNKANSAVSKEEKAALTKVQSATDALKESADVLLESGSKSVFAQKDITTKDENGVESTVRGYDVEGIYKAVEAFVKDYNAVINAVNDSDSEAVNRRTESLVHTVMNNSKMLSSIGITLKDDSTLSIDKDTFGKSNMTTVKTLFNGNGSFGYRASAQASLIHFSAQREASKTNSYNSNGAYNNYFNAGDLFSTYL